MVRRHPQTPRNYRSATTAGAGHVPITTSSEAGTGVSDPGLAWLGAPPTSAPSTTLATSSDLPGAAELSQAPSHGHETAPPMPSNARSVSRTRTVSSARPPRGQTGSLAPRPPRRSELGWADAAEVADPQLRVLFQASAEVVSREPGGGRRPPPIPSSGKRRRAAARKSTPWFRFGTVCTTARASFERLGDWLRSEPAAVLRPGAKPFLFAGRRLRALRQFVAECGGSGLSMADQTRLYSLLVMGSWQACEVEAPAPPSAAPKSADDANEGTSHGGPHGGGVGGEPAAGNAAGGTGRNGGDPTANPNGQSRGRGLDDVFGSPTAFRNAIRDDLDKSIIDAGWRKVVLIEGGRSYIAYFRCALAVALAALASAKRKQLRRSAEDVGERRDHPIDGEAFALHQEEIDKVTAEPSFVLGVHLYSDCTLVSRSGGTLMVLLYCVFEPYGGESISCIAWLCPLCSDILWSATGWVHVC